MEILNKFNILEILKFFYNIEQYFNIPIFTNVITSKMNIQTSMSSLTTIPKQSIIFNFIQIIKNYFLFDNLLQLLVFKQLNLGFPLKKTLNTANHNKNSYTPLMVGQVYGQYKGSILPFYANTASWYIRTGILADVKL